MAHIRKAINSNTTPYAHLYRRALWLRLRRTQLIQEPLCRLCIQQGYTTAAKIADHIIPHKGDESLFFDNKNLQSLCKLCHDGLKAQQEEHGYHRAIGEDGYPIDMNHPVNRPRT